MRAKVAIIFQVLLVILLLSSSIILEPVLFRGFANAAYLEGESEIIGENEDTYKLYPPEIIMPPEYPPPRYNNFYYFVNSLSVISWRPLSYGDLKIYLLKSNYNVQRKRIISLGEAYRRKEVTISEYFGGNVSKIAVTSHSDSYIFIIAGEIISGGMQTRTVTRDALIPPYAKRVVLDVYCIEEGRWAGNKSFSPSDRMLGSKIRKGVVLQEGQSTVWSGIREYEKRAGQYSDTHNLLEVYEGVQRDTKLVREVDSMKRRLKYNSIGMVAVKSGRIIGIEAFSTHELFAYQFVKLFNSYYYTDVAPVYYKGISISAIKRFIKNLSNSAIMVNTDYTGQGVLYDASYNGFHGGVLDFGGIIHISLIK